MKNIRIYPEDKLLSTDITADEEYIYIADKLNHCIKKLTISLKSVEVIAGICGISGFLDGPLGFNRLNQPSNLGIDAKGIIYFYDEGNRYMRRVSVDREVATLLNGACK